MDKKFWDYITRVTVLTMTIMSIFLVIYLLFDKNYLVDETYSLILIIGISGIIEITFALFMRIKSNVNRNEIYKLNKLMEYSKKRKELEEEIDLLTRELLHSDLAEYLDVNRLVFAGQNAIDINKSINYDSFLNQFGLLSEKIEMRKNSAVFLTPFTNEGEELFSMCQKILSGVDIFLQKTDNYVEKEDIMMNIVSLIVQSEIVVVNINGRNPNVYYELGIAHAIGKPTILLSKAKFDLKDIGFDIRQKRIIIYKSKSDLEKQLLYQVSRMRT